MKIQIDFTTIVDINYFYSIVNCDKKCYIIFVKIFTIVVKESDESHSRCGGDRRPHLGCGKGCGSCARLPDPGMGNSDSAPRKGMS